MRTMKAILLVAVLAMSSTAANAGTWTFGLNGDASIPMGDFGDTFKTGYGGGVYADHWIKEDYAFGIDVNGDFHRAEDDVEDAVAALVLLAGGGTVEPKITANIISVNAHGIWSPAVSAPLQPWITYGAGLYHIQTKIEDAGIADGDDSANKFGFNLGLGADMKAGDAMKIGAQVRYHYVLSAIEEADGDEKAANYVTAGIHLTFMTAGTTK